MKTALVTVRDHASAFLAAKTPKAKAEIENAVAARAAVSKRLRWTNLHRAIVAGDAVRVTAYSLEGEAKREAWAGIRASEAPAKPKAKGKAKAKPAAKAAAKPAKPVTPNAMAKAIVEMDEGAFAEFFGQIMAIRTGK